MRNERGSFLIIVAVLFAILAFVAGSHYVGEFTSAKGNRQLAYVAQAGNAARSGLTECIDWFRRQTRPVRNWTAPDQAFKPLLATCDTSNEAMGMTREFPIRISVPDSNIWARYEILRAGNPLGVGLAVDGDPFKAGIVHDISNEKMRSDVRVGTYWSIPVTATIFRRYDFTKDSTGTFYVTAYNQAPNRVLAVSRLRTEIRALPWGNTPFSAIVTNDCQTVTVSHNAVVDSGSHPGVICVANAAAGAVVTTGGSVQGYPLYEDTTSRLSVTDVFGAPLTDIKQTADLVVPVGTTSPVLPPMALTVFEGDGVYDQSHPLQAGGVIITQGNLTIDPRSNSNFSGIIHTQNLTVAGPATLVGMIIVTGTVTLDATNGPVLIKSDDGVVNSVRQQLLSYREIRAARTLTQEVSH